MAGTAKPRQVARELLEGKTPSRPLFLPIVFSLGARIESVPLRTYLGNPTKIASALRQIRGRVPADGVTCYFDPFLEAEALGGTVEWATDDGPPRLVWPGGVAENGLPHGIRGAEEAAKSGRVPVVVEVIKRMKDAVRDSALLMVGLNGPMALAGMLTDQAPTTEAVEVAGAAVTEIARTLLEAGTNVIVMREGFPTEVAAEISEQAAGELETIRNIVRFHEALLMFLPTGRAAVGRSAADENTIANEVIPCIEWPRRIYGAAGIGFERDSVPWGLALPVDAFVEKENEYAQFEHGMNLIVGAARPAVVTTASDVPAASDMKRLGRISAAMAQAGPRTAGQA